MAEDHSTRWNRRSFLKATGAVGLAAGVSSAASASDGGSGDDRFDGLIVGLNSEGSVSTAAAAVERDLPSDAQIERRDDTLQFAKVTADSTDVSIQSSLAERLREHPRVKYVEQERELVALSDDPQFSEQYAPQLVRAPTAWETSLGSEGVTIAVVDQGVKYDHPDLQAQFGEVKGKDFVDDDGDPMPTADREFHGTHVAGIASATTDNGVGVAGMSNSTLLSGRALGASGRGSLSAIASAVRWAADQGADIINMSLGGGGRTDTMKNAVSYALDNGALPICAAGNSGNRGVSYPAKYDECVAVGAIDSEENLTDFSQYGPNLDVVAPGQDVLSTSTRNGGYERVPGTSMACPAASGVAALGLATRDVSGPNELRQLLKETAVDIGLSEDRQGAGRADAANIVKTGDPAIPDAEFTFDPAEPAVDEEVTFDASESSDPDGEIVSYEWDFGDGTTFEGVSGGHAYGEPGEYTVTLTVTDDGGNTDTSQATVAVVDPDTGNCGTESETSSADGRLWGWWASEEYTFTSDLADPCQVVFSLEGPASADFDLYVTLDGRTPSPRDFDKRSISPDSSEQIVIEDVDPDAEMGILVDAYAGGGSYTVTAEELGR